MKSSFGKNLRVTIFGGSHEDHIGVCIEGFPSDFAIDFQALQAFMQRRAPGQNPYSTPRKERDIPRLQSRDPLTFIIQNEDRKSGHYSNLRQVPRPGHADYTARVKYGDQINMAGGGPFSARMTAPLCVAGGIALQYLAAQGIQIHGEVTEIHGVRGEKMLEEILAAKAKGDSVGGIVSAQVTGLPPGIGGPMYDGLESILAPIIFGIPAVKGLSFGSGFAGSRLLGSENNDPFVFQEGKVKTLTNHSGGILGGISTGMPLTLSVAFKPTPSIAKPQQSVNLQQKTEETLIIEGRHDPCVVLRAVPVVEAAIALGLLDAMMEEQ